MKSCLYPVQVARSTADARCGSTMALAWSRGAVGLLEAGAVAVVWLAGIAFPPQAAMPSASRVVAAPAARARAAIAVIAPGSEMPGRHSAAALSSAAARASARVTVRAKARARVTG